MGLWSGLFCQQNSHEGKHETSLPKVQQWAA
jgi:hypothetical protein